MKRTHSPNGRLNYLATLSSKFSAPPIISAEMIQKIQGLEEIDDAEFDSIYPPRIRAISDIQWSSIAAAHHIADLIGRNSKYRFIDIGSGVGKLCTLLSFLTELEIFGIEQRKNLFEVSKAIAQENALDRVHFIHGNMLDLNWSDYDIFYFYNPFQEHICDDTDIALIDRDIDLDRKHYVQYVSEVFRQMTWLTPGKKVITFHGYGGQMPSTMKFLDSRPVDNGELCLWEKVAGENSL
ncbi:methyltransferase domain-containing protein [Bdellovibrio svalbardensis]|uniref:Class I SAM-dependent methyltransferase n=1 Tax=Bdellovibrio svalbardensis TaxID=2972972 RepID=A0ABT6DMT5_9BACT|nr:methyltransferase domain-containing protein [Bdellovibrio svalbardensis]MDG0818187.1 class I SAM-dependent methyltransferase [Bdellovibrio svalbardensis]